MAFNRFMGGAAASVLAVVCAYEAQAQITSAQLRGSVVDASGAPVAGASVTIVDTRTNAASAATTSDEGNFFRPNLRVGGPYTLTVVAEGFQGEQVNIGSLAIGSNDPVVISLDSAARETIVVTGQLIETIDINNGVGSVFTAEDIADTPILDRDLSNIIELDPFASITGDSGELGVISFGGIEPRLNGFVVDGALIGDKFKLEEAFYPTLRQPVSLDVIEAASATFSEYSVLAAGAQGGLVNTVTKSGTNEFDGNIYYRFGNDSLIGDESDGREVPTGDFEETDYGFTVGGPIIKDKLFFLVNYEDFEAETPVIGNLTDDELAVFEEIRQAFLTATDEGGNLRYEGFDPGVKTNTANDVTTSERLFLKLDYLLNDSHRLSGWYLKAEDGRLQNTDGLDYLFPSAFYDKTVDIDLYHGQLTSDWTNNLSTTFRFIYKEQVTGQTPRSELLDDGSTRFPTLLVADERLGDTAEAGPDPFRQANAFEDEQLQLFGSANYILGDHLLMFGGEYQDYELDNLFGQFCRGEYEFGSIQDVLDGNAGVSYQNTPTNDCGDRTAAWGYQKLDLFAQDTWQINPDLSINYGFRYERYSSDDEVPIQGNFPAEYGAETAVGVDGLDIIQPRFGFDWNAPYDVKVQGGFGLFSGGDPVVWFSNAYSPLPTLAFGGVTDYSGFTNVPQALQDQAATNVGPFNYDHISPTFDIPSLWKASVALEREFDFGRFGDGWLLGTQLVLTEVEDGAAFINRAQLADSIADADLAASVAANTGVAPDGRPIYADARSTGDAIALINSGEGESFAVSFDVEKDWDFGLTFYGAYTYTDADRLIPGSSSRHISNYRSLVTTDRNSAGPSGTSVFEVQDRFVFQTKYEREFVQGLESQFVLKGVFESGPVSNAGYINFLDSRSRIFGRAAGGSPFGGVDQLYIPTLNAAGDGFDDQAVIFSSAANEARFFEEAENLGLLGAAGGFAEKNGLRGAWNQRFDFGFSQELPGFPGASKFVGDNQLKLTVDIFNVANLLNSDWGTQVDDPRFDSLSVVEAFLVPTENANQFRNGQPIIIDGETGALNDDGEFVPFGITDAIIGGGHGAACPTAESCTYLYDTVFSNGTSQAALEDSVYKIRIGLRYEF